jgi:hypothetical protein
MSADILTDGEHPHGTIEGFQRGCRSAACPAPVSCRTVHTRYTGDYGFRKKFDAGMTPAEIIESERPTRKATVRPAVPTKEKPAPKERPHSKHRERVRELHAEEMLDCEIAEKIGLSRRQVANIRVDLELPAHRMIDPEIVRAHHAAGMNDAQIAAAINATRKRKTSRGAVFGIRKRLGLPTNYTLATAGVSSSQGTA